MTPAERDMLSEELSAYLDGELEPPRSLEIEALLLESREVRGILKDLGRVADRVAALPRVPAPLDLTAAVRARLEPQVIPLGTSIWAWPVRTYVGASSAAAAVLLIAIAFWTMRPSNRPAPRASEVARELGVALSEPIPEAARVEVSGDDLATLRGLGYAGDAFESDDEFAAHAADMLEREEESAAGVGGAGVLGAEPAGVAIAMRGRSDAPPMTAAPASPVEDFAKSETADMLDRGLPRPSLGVAVAVPAARESLRQQSPPLMRILVQTRDADGFAQALQAAEAIEPASPTQQRIAGGPPGEPVEVVSEVDAAQFESLLHQLERQSPDDVQIALNFSPRDLPRVRRLLAEQVEPSLADALEEAHAGDSDGAGVARHIYMQQHPGVARGRAAERPAERDEPRAAGTRDASRGERRMQRPAGRERALETTAPGPPAGGIGSEGADEALRSGTPPAAASSAAANRPPAPLRTGVAYIDHALARAELTAVSLGRISVGITVLPPPNPPTASRPAELPARD